MYRHSTTAIKRRYPRRWKWHYHTRRSCWLVLPPTGFSLESSECYDPLPSQANFKWSTPKLWVPASDAPAIIQKLTVIYSYRHSCSLEISTLALLLKHQSATLHELHITRYPEPRSVSGLLVEGLRCLTINDLNIDRNCEWPSKLIMHNRSTLKYLALGVSSTIARCPIQDRLKHKLPTSFAETTKGQLSPSEPAMEMLALESLALSGLNLEDIVGGGALNSQIDFKLLTVFKVESCSRLNEAFAAIVSSGNSTLSALKLTSFFLRHEEGDLEFAQNLTLFLTSFAGLKHLSLIIEGQSRAMSKRPILEAHGKTLRTLVWDERSGPRKKTDTDTALFLNNNGLGLISLSCPKLYALGLCVQWGPCKSDKPTTASSTVKIVMWHPLGKLKLIAHRISRWYPAGCLSFERCICAICQELIWLHLTYQ